jgi:hypothetical protein
MDSSSIELTSADLKRLSTISSSSSSLSCADENDASSTITSSSSIVVTGTVSTTRVCNDEMKDTTQFKATRIVSIIIDVDE